jgi:hypothetical protein
LSPVAKKQWVMNSSISVPHRYSPTK